VTDTGIRFPDGLRAPQEWLDGILTKAPGETPDFVKHELLSVVRDFCLRGRAWVRWLAPMPILAGAQYVTVEPNIDEDPPGLNVDAVVHEVLEAFNAASGLPLASRNRSMSVANPMLDGGGSSYSMFQPGMLELFPPPAAPFSLRLLGVLVPSTLDIPEWMTMDYFDPICSGVLSRVHLKPGPNYDRALGLYHRSLYVQGRAIARSRARTALTGSDQEWRFNRFGA
jgi:hypothetical protein